MKVWKKGIGSGDAVLVPIALAAWWLLVMAPRAEAYIDPSAGGMMVQLILAGTAGVAVLVRLLWGRVKRVFGFSDSEDASSAAIKSPDDRV
jgi:hypothetical protein